jgi:hypothetical protein
MDPWKILKGGQLGYILVNFTGAPAYDVTLSGNPVRDSPDNRSRFVGKDPIDVDLITSGNMPDSTVTISWYASADRSGGAQKHHITL